MLALLSGLFGALFSNTVLFWIAIKTVLTVLFLTVLPIVLTNVFKSIVDGVLGLVASTIGSVSPMSLQLTGIAGFFATQLGIPACFAVIFSAIAVKFTFRLIPFVRI